MRDNEQARMKLQQAIAFGEAASILQERASARRACAGGPSEDFKTPPTFGCSGKQGCEKRVSADGGWCSECCKWLEDVEKSQEPDENGDLVTVEPTSPADAETAGKEARKLDEDDIFEDGYVWDADTLRWVSGGWSLHAAGNGWSLGYKGATFSVSRDLKSLLDLANEGHPDDQREVDLEDHVAVEWARYGRTSKYIFAWANFRWDSCSMHWRRGEWAVYLTQEGAWISRELTGDMGELWETLVGAIEAATPPVKTPLPENVGQSGTPDEHQALRAAGWAPASRGFSWAKGNHVLWCTAGGNWRSRRVEDKSWRRIHEHLQGALDCYSDPDV